MKKKLLIALAILAALAVATVILATLFIDKAIKAGVETLGPKFTQVDVKLDTVKLSLLGGSGSLEGLLIGNPQGYKTPHSFKIGSAHLALQPSSILSDKVIIRSINIQQPEICFEGNLSGNNLSQIQKNVESSLGTPATNNAPASTSESEPSRKLQVDEFVLNGAKVTVHSSLLGNKPVSLTLPEIRLTNLGTGPDGITPRNLTDAILAQVNKETLKAVAAEFTRAGSEVLNNASSSSKEALDNVKKTTQGVTDLFKKKK